MTRPPAPRREERGYWVAWFFATSTTGLLAGFLVAHCLILGRFFTWMVASGWQPVLGETYAIFRQEQGVRGYLALLMLQTLATLGFLVAVFVSWQAVRVVEPPVHLFATGPVLNGVSTLLIIPLGRHGCGISASPPASRAAVERTRQAR
jgi:hypothetical protein